MSVDELKQLMQDIKLRESSRSTEQTHELMAFIESRLRETLK